MSEPTPEGKGSDRTLLRWRPPSSTQEIHRLDGRAVSDFVTAPAGETGEDASVSDAVASDAAVEATLLGQADTLEPDASAPAWQDGILPAGTLIGERYVLEHHVSSGSFGAVYKASDRLIDKHAVALKILHRAALSEDAEHTALRELRLIAAVAHPSVVQFKDYGWIDGRLWFAMPWYEGRTLDERLSTPEGERLALTRKAARPIFERLAHGLAAMHSVGVRHHDIKPENVFLSEVAGFDEGLPVLLDLGIAAEGGEQPAGFTTEYTAPETAARALGREAGHIGDEADVFALALTLRAALEPETMPECEGPALALLHRRASHPVSPPSGRDLRYLSPHFKRWLSLEPSERPSADEFARELCVLTEPEERREARRRMLRRILPVIALAAAAVAALAWELREQTVALDEQRERLSEQMEETERLRQWSNQTLAELEDQVEAVGEKDKQLRRAVDVARRLDDKLRRTSKDRQTVARSLRRVKGELADLDAQHSALRGEHEALSSERDALQKQQRALEAERDRLGQNLVQLSEERDELSREGDQLREAQSRLQRKVADVEAALARVEDRLRDAEQRNAEALAARDALRVERDQLNQDVRRMQRDLTSLEHQLAVANRRRPSPTKASEAAPPSPAAPVDELPVPTSGNDPVQ